MMSEKAVSRAIRGHFKFLVESALLEEHEEEEHEFIRLHI